MMRHNPLTFAALLAVGMTGNVPLGAQDRRPDAPASGPGKLYFLDGDRLAVIRPDGSKPVQLPRTLASLGYFQPYTARVSPNGRRLAFGLGELREGAMHPPSSVQVMDVTRGEHIEEVVSLPGVEVSNWAWSPDGKKLAVSTWDPANRTRNWVKDLRTRELTEVKLPRGKTADGEVRMSVHDWSPDGKSFVASGRGVHVVRADGSGARRLTGESITVHGGTCRFSPDGSKILFVGTEEGKGEALYVVNTAGGRPTPVVQYLNFSDLRACWSPDGRRIAYSVTFLDEKGGRGTESNLNVIDADGKNSVTIATATHEPHEIKLLLLDWR